VNAIAAIAEEDEAMRERRDRGASRSRERRCIVTGEVLPETHLIRFVVGPDQTIVPDLAAKLPGRGIWVSADRESLTRAIAKNLFAKAAKASVKADADLPDRIEALLVQRMLNDLGLARRAGELILGFDQVTRSFEEKTRIAAIVEASDGAADGRRKLLGAAQARGLEFTVIDMLSITELSLALGRDNVVHAALKPGRLAERLVFEMGRLKGFRSAVPGKNRTGDAPAGTKGFA
jgi:predicted RNA-binding protein YlxR (DUF448 family)